MTALRGAAVTDVGRTRSVNQDSALTSSFLMAVADGMGGHRAGEVASALALRSMAGHRHFADLDEVIEAVRLANEAILSAADDAPELRGMGTTVCALALVDPGGVEEQLALVNVGDSRAYRLRGGHLEQLTVDHSLVQLMVQEGQLRPEDAESHPQRNILIRALGIENDVEIDGWALPVVAEDRYLLCSDGLFNEVSLSRLGALLRAYASPEEAARVLVDEAVTAGGRDNVTCVVVDIVADIVADEGDPPSPEPTDMHLVPSPRGEAPAPGLLAVANVAPATLAPAVPLPSVERDQPDRPPVAARPRRLTLRLVLFLAAVAAVLILAFSAPGWVSRRTYFVGFQGEQVVIFRGRPGGLLWIDPTVVETPDPPLTRSQLAAAQCASIERHVASTSLSDARAFVAAIRAERAAMSNPQPCPSGA